MKRYTYLLTVLMVFSLFFSCEKSAEKERYYTDSSGPINLISVFSDKDTYALIEPGLSDSLVFGKIFPGLYYPPEIMFATRHFDAKLFKKFNTTRLILDVQQGEPSIVFEKNKFAKPQAYVKVSGNSSEEILSLLKANQDSLIGIYRWADRQFLLRGYLSDNNKDIAPLDSLGIEMVIPKELNMAKKEDNFVWYRKDYLNVVQNKDARDDGIVTQESQDIINILLFKIPYTKDTLTKDELYFVMDSVTSKYTRGGKEPVLKYIKTQNDSIEVLVYDHIQVELNPMLSDFYDFTLIHDKEDKAVYEAQGYWSMTLSQMGGPFTSKIILDKKNKMLYVADAVLFAPLNHGKSKKRDYITSMESIFTTFKIKE